MSAPPPHAVRDDVSTPFKYSEVDARLRQSTGNHVFSENVSDAVMMGLHPCGQSLSVNGIPEASWNESLVHSHRVRST